MWRLKLVRWLLSKLLGGFYICILLYWIFPILKLDWKTMAFWEFYSWITTTLLLAGITAHILVTPPKIPKIKNKTRNLNEQS